VLVGHSDAVTCVAVSVTNKTQVLSGSKDMNLILWDLLTGEEVHTLAGHLGPVIGVKVSADGEYCIEIHISMPCRLILILQVPLPFLEAMTRP